LIVVPTPVTWSTWTVIARLVGGTSMSPIVPAADSPKVSAVSCAPETTGCRTMRPTTWLGSPNALVLRCSGRRSLFVTMSAVT
jgi:hypothetical protein